MLSMKTIFTLLCIAITGAVVAQHDFYNKKWSQVYRHEASSLPQSALKVVDEIYAQAKREQNIPHLTKALIYQSKFGLTQPNAELTIMAKWKAEIAAAKTPLRNILESITANMYWQYFQSNRWAIYDRTRKQTSVNENDFRTWDRDNFFKEINKHFQLSLQDAEKLKSINLHTIDEILTDAENSKLYRPTLYDFIAHEALTFYSSNESYLDEFNKKIDLATPSYFEDVASVVLPADSLTPAVQVVRIFKDLIAFHEKDTNPNAYVNLQLEWIKFLGEQEDFVNERELKKNALLKLKAKFQHHEASTHITFELANTLKEEGLTYEPKGSTEGQFRLRDALALCTEAITTYPKSNGAERCVILKNHILDKGLSLNFESFVPIQKNSRIHIEYKNIDSLIFKTYPVTLEFWNQTFNVLDDSTRLAALSKLQATHQWNVALPNLQDYQYHTTEVVVPPLSVGSYLVIAHTNAPLDSANTLFAYGLIQVTNLALIDASFDNKQRHQVVDRNTGRPLADVDVRSKSVKNNSTASVEWHDNTDKNGFIEIKFKKDQGWQYNSWVTYKGDQAMFGKFYAYPNYSDNDDEDEGFAAKSFLFTDRSIYRPGQTIFFKGILIKTKKNKSSLVTGQWVEVYLDDANGKEIGMLRLKTNQYGSFSGEFKLPPSGITGEYSLYVEEDSEDESNFYSNLEDFYEGRIDISVEEYKRPTFEVTFKKVSGEYKVNDSVTVKGDAMAFSGSKIGKAKVSYSVVRTILYPNWYYWTNRYQYSDEEEIESGETMTNGTGEFEIIFKALADEEVRKENFPVFHYEVTANVTDINGETRSSTTTVNIGYHSLRATLQTPEKVSQTSLNNTFTVSVMNLNGEVVHSAGTIAIYKTKVPKLTRPRPWEAPDLPLINEEAFSTLFPYDNYLDTPDERLPSKGNLMIELKFNTATSSEVKWSVNETWAQGSYIAELRTKDKDGNDISEMARFIVQSASGKTALENKVFVLEMDKSSYSIGEIARVKIGSASPDMTIVLCVDKNERDQKLYIERLENNSKEILIPVTAEMEGGFLVSAYGVNFNSFYSESKRVLVSAVREKFEIETLTFKDKLQPGAKQTWSFLIKSENSAHLESELLASMYDASLDQFKSHDWRFNPKEQPRYYGSGEASAKNSFDVFYFTVRNRGQNYYVYPNQSYDKLDWFGFTITNNKYVANQYFQRLYSTGMAYGEPSKVTTLKSKALKKGFVSGKITSASDGEPMPGANIIVKGTTRGTSTDMNGNYTIEVSKDETLVFTFIGTNTVEAGVGNRNIMNVSLAEDAMQLAEVVVVGYGMEQKRDLTGAAMSVSFDVDIENDPYESLSQAKGVQLSLSGESVMIMSARAPFSPSNEERPLYVVDGVIVNYFEVDKSDLATAQVLQGSAATALYGAKAANGVVIITTKSGQKKLDEEMAKVNARKDFKETAFFFPHLTTDLEGRVQFTFTTPESLTRWKLQLLAHTKSLNSTIKTLQSITQKDLMVTPNAPRFLRVNDEIIFSVKISNLTNKSKTGNAALQLSNAVTGQPLDAQFINVVRNQPFTVAAKGSTEISWKLKVPTGVDAVQYKVIAKAGSFSDGEQNALPVLSNRMLVTETMPMYVRGGEKKAFTLEKLKSTSSQTLTHHQLTLEVSSNPAWYAVQALPYLMEFPHECAEQLFSRFYANALASHIVNSTPKVKAVFDEWTSSNALVSELEKNQELKNIIIQETPWFRDAQNETNQKKRIALLFDLNTMQNQMSAVLLKLKELQLSSGGFSWFAGGQYPSRYITQHVASGLGHLQHLNVKLAEDANSIQRNAVAFLDGEILTDYHSILERANFYRTQAKTAQEGSARYAEYLEKQQVSPLQIQYLYMRSFYPFLPIDTEVRTAVEYYQKQSAKYWMSFNIYMKGMIALIHHRLNNPMLPKAILLSLKENSVQDDELGMYWKENKPSWYWHESPVEAQALLIEAFAEIEYTDQQSRLQTLDNLRIWLLKNKQTNQWKTTKATTEAVYALLLMGSDWLALDNQLEVSVANKKVDPGSKPEAGTGYFKTAWKGESITPAMSEVTLESKSKSISWAGMYWQYFEDLDKITSAKTPLKLSKKVFVVERDERGEILTEVDPKTPVAVGTLLRVRIELNADRAMEFVHMKDMRASGLEPVDVLSEYKWQEGLWYYQSTKDASTNFFFDNVEPGVYVFEYDLRASNKGDFSNGITTIQCMYAPEFSSHSEGIRIRVK
jgi:TonB-dependent SusC/RagA subfamily outer membrane receptor